MFAFFNDVAEIYGKLNKMHGCQHGASAIAEGWK